jgi:hypothetical protein
MVAQSRSRYDRWGNIWCHACHRYLVPARFTFRRLKTGHFPVSECRDCRNRRYKRYRTRVAQDPVRYQQLLARDGEMRRRRSAERREERRELAQQAIRSLLDRGFTRQEIAHLAGAHPGSIRAWLEGEWQIMPTSLARLTRVMRAAVDVQPILPAPRSVNRQAHHPDFFRILSAMEGN